MTHVSEPGGPGSVPAQEPAQPRPQPERSAEPWVEAPPAPVFGWYIPAVQPSSASEGSGKDPTLAATPLGHGMLGYGPPLAYGPSPGYGPPAA